MVGVAGRSGRKPKPVMRKIAAGNPGKRALNKDQPDFELVTTVLPPEWMDGPARDLWETVAPLLCQQQVLQATDIQNLQVYCDAYGQFRAAVADIAKNGITVSTPMGGVAKNPALTAKKEAVGIMNSYGSMLGLDPASRQRLTGPKKPGAGNPFAGLLPK